MTGLTNFSRMAVAKRAFSVLIGAGLAVFATAPAVEAGTLLCPNPLGGSITRQLEITWNSILFPGGIAECADYGDTPSAGPKDPIYSYNSVNYPLIEKDVDPATCPGSCPNLNIQGSKDGTFQILGAPGDYLLMLKFGGAQGQSRFPDWFVVFLSGISSGGWDLIPDGLDNGLSHANIWGGPNAPTPMPEPASLILLGTGLFGAATGAARRRRKARS